jgi:hypothetical protein
VLAFGRAARARMEREISRVVHPRTARPNNLMKLKSRCAGLRFASPLGWMAARTRAPPQVGVPLISRSVRPALWVVLQTKGP